MLVDGAGQIKMTKVRLPLGSKVAALISIDPGRESATF